jgi:enoyl-CoA hydratase/carnithine racemase
MLLVRQTEGRAFSAGGDIKEIINWLKVNQGRPLNGGPPSSIALTESRTDEDACTSRMGPFRLHPTGV